MECDDDVHKITNCKIQDIGCKHVPSKQLIYSMNSNIKHLINFYWFVDFSVSFDGSKEILLVRNIWRRVQPEYIQPRESIRTFVDIFFDVAGKHRKTAKPWVVLSLVRDWRIEKRGKEIRNDQEARLPSGTERDLWTRVARVQG